MHNGMTVQDLIDICKNNNLPMSTKISVMGITDNIVANIKADNTIITLDEENFVCNDCDNEFFEELIMQYNDCIYGKGDYDE